MDKRKLFEAALSIISPWYIDRMEFNSEMRRLDIYINFERGAKFLPNESTHTGECDVYDTKPKTWRHLNFLGVALLHSATN